VLRFERGYVEAQEWLYSPETRDELDELCRKARAYKAALKVTGRAQEC
jgi:hypothetical protein